MFACCSSRGFATSSECRHVLLGAQWVARVHALAYATSLLLRGQAKSPFPCACCSISCAAARLRCCPHSWTWLRRYPPALLASRFRGTHRRGPRLKVTQCSKHTSRGHLWQFQQRLPAEISKRPRIAYTGITASYWLLTHARHHRDLSIVLRNRMVVKPHIAFADVVRQVLFSEVLTIRQATFNLLDNITTATPGCQGMCLHLR